MQGFERDGRARARVAAAAVLALAAVVRVDRAQTAPSDVPAAVAATRPAAPVTQPTTQPADPVLHAMPRDATQPAIPDTQPAGPGHRAPASRPTSGPARQISLNFKDAPLDAVLDHLSEAAGLVIIKEGAVDGRVTVQSKQPVSPEEAVTLLGAVLKANGFAAIQDGRIVKIIARDKAKKGSIPVHIGADPEQIAATEALITQVIPLKNVDAVKLRQDLQPLLGTDADVAASSASNSIIITDASANIRRIAQIIAPMDKGDTASETALKVIHLKFANAAASAKLLASVFRSEGGGGGGGGMTPQQMMQMQQQGGQPPQPAGGGGGGGRLTGNAVEQALRGGHVHADADERTNSLIITAPAETLKLIEEILKDLDSNPVPASELKAFRLNYAEAEATSKLLTNLFKGGGDSPPNPYFFNPFGGMGDQSNKIKVNITFDERTNSVLVSAPADVLRSVDALIKDLDASPGTGMEIRFFTLKYADAWSTSKMITSLFEPETKDQGFNPFRYYFGMASQGNQKQGKLTATSDDRTNTLVVTGPKEAMKVVEGLVKQLDANTTSEEALFLYHLRNAQAVNLEIVLNTLFGNTQNGQNGQGQGQPGQQGGPNGQQFQGQQQQRQGGPRSSLGNSSNGQAGGTGIGSRRGTRNGQGGATANRNTPRMPQGLSQAATELSGQVFVVADADTNTLIVTTASKYREEVRQIIAELDRPAPQVLIKVLVAEVTHDNSADWGLDFSILNRRPSGNGQQAGTSLGNAGAASNGGLVVSLMETNLNATLHALATQGKLDVLSRPYILASDNQEATITVGNEVPFITDTRITELGQQINTIQYQDVGIILDVTPHINPEGLVILDVAPEISQLTDQSVPISAGVAAPVIAKRSAQSRVGIKNGQTIVIGGLMEDRKTSTISKVPLLGDIPFVGELFRRTQVSKTKTELLIFLTPHVAQQPDLLKGMSKDEMSGTRLTPSAVDKGVFEEHIFGMRRGATPTSQPADPSTTQPVRWIGDAAEHAPDSTQTSAPTTGPSQEVRDLSQTR